MADQTAVASARAGNPHAYEGWSQKFKRKFNENPWVPLGCLATVGALVMSAVKMRAGQAKQMNYWMRARVGLQGVTLVALVAGAMALQKEKEEAASAGSVLSAEQVRRQEKEEFEQRMRDAEATYEQERTFVQGAAARRAKLVESGPSVPAPADVRTISERIQSGGSSGKSWWKFW